MKEYRSGLSIAFFIPIVIVSSPMQARERALLIAPWGNPGIHLIADNQRGPWVRRWVGGKGSVRVMLTVYRSHNDAERVANLARGLGERPADDDYETFLQTFLPRRWPVMGRTPRAVGYNATARGVCLEIHIEHDGGTPHSLCSASRPDSAAVATVLAPKSKDCATMAALLLARYAARHPVRLSPLDRG